MVQHLIRPNRNNTFITLLLCTFYIFIHCLFFARYNLFLKLFQRGFGRNIYVEPSQLWKVLDMKNMKITLSPAGFVLVLFLLSSPGFSLRCYNCNSRHDKSCYNLTMGKSHNTVVQDCEQEGMECLQKVGKIYKISYFYNFLTFLRLSIGDNNRPFFITILYFLLRQEPW